ncbi:MAG: ATP-binding protein [Kiritimatiellia bacterium]
MLVVLNNITHLRQLEAEVRRRAEESAIGILAAQTAHEIKNPLVTLKTFADLLPTHYDDHDFRANFAPLVAREVERINHTVQHLLQFSGPVEPDFQMISAHALVRQVLATGRKRTQGRPFSFRDELAATAEWVRADPRLLSLAVENLLTNATEAMEAGTITVSSRNLGPGEALLFCLEIRDDGPGISADKVREVFKPFFTTKATGSGLGLSQSRRIVEAHGGEIFLESRAGQGTLVRILLSAQNRPEPAG